MNMHKTKFHINIKIIKNQIRMIIYNQIKIFMMRMKIFKKLLWKAIKIKIRKNIINEFIIKFIKKCT